MLLFFGMHHTGVNAQDPFSEAIAAANALPDYGPEIKRGWELFAKDDFEEASRMFKQAIKTDDRAEAYLGLSLIEAANGSMDELYKNHIAFYKGSKNPSYHMDMMWSMGPSRKDKDQLDYLYMVTEREKGAVRAKAYQNLGYHHRLSTNHAKATESFQQVGAMGKWQVLGEFENISESGFDKDFGALEHPEGDHIFKNKNGAEVQWFDIKAPRYDNWVDLEYFFYCENSVIYAQTFAESPVEQDVYIRLGVSGSLKCYVNDVLTYSAPKERDNDLDSYVVKARLGKGYNRILLKVGKSEAQGCNFLMRITDQEGEPLTGLNFESAYQPYEKKDPQAEIVQRPSEIFFKRALERFPWHIDYHLSLIQFYLQSGRTYEAMDILEIARERFPDSSYLQYMLIDAYRRDGNRTATAALRENYKSRFPNSLLTLEMRYSEAMETEDLKEADELINAIERVEKHTANVYKKKIELAAKRNEVENILKLLDEAHSKYPDDVFFVNLKAQIEEDVKNNLTEAIKAYENYLASNYDEDAITRLCQLYFQAGKSNKAFEGFQELLDHNEIAVGYLKTLSEIHYNLQDYGKAKYYLDECIKIAPYISNYYKAYGDVYMQEANKPQAQEMYNRALRYNPYDYDTRAALRRAKGLDDVFTLFEKEDVYSLYANAPGAEAYPEDNSIILLDDLSNVIYENGGSELKRTFLIKVFNNSGVDTWKEYTVSVFNNQGGRVEKAEVIKANGDRIAARQNGADLVFENLDAGDAIHVSYRLQNFYYGRLGAHFWSKFYFSRYFPVQKARYSLLVPEGRAFSAKPIHFDLEPSVQKVEHYTLHTWELNDEPAVQSEYDSSPLNDFGKVLHISTMPDWSFVADWYADLAFAKSKVDYEIEQSVKRLFPEGEELETLEKVQRIYGFITREIRYSSVSFIQSGLIPQKASTVLSRKQGDCKDVSTLFVSMCAAIGVEANLVLINTKNYGRDDMVLPSINFNHCIARTEIDGEVYFLELTDDHLPFGAIYASVVRSLALEIPSQRGVGSDVQFLDFKKRIPNATYRVTEIVPDGNSLLVSRRNVRTGAKACSIRDSYSSLSEEARFKDMQDAVSSGKHNAKLNSLHFDENLYSQAPEVSYQYAYTLTDAFTEIAGMRIFKVPIGSSIPDLKFLSRDERHTPLTMWNLMNSDVYEERVVISIPEGQQIDLPENVEINSPYLKYSLKGTMQNGKIEFVKYIELLQDFVPIEDVDEFKEVCKKIMKADDLQLGLR